MQQRAYKKQLHGSCHILWTAGSAVLDRGRPRYMCIKAFCIDLEASAAAYSYGGDGEIGRSNFGFKPTQYGVHGKLGSQGWPCLVGSTGRHNPCGLAQCISGFGSNLELEGGTPV